MRHFPRLTLTGAVTFVGVFATYLTDGLIGRQGPSLFAVLALVALLLMWAADTDGSTTWAGHWLGEVGRRTPTWFVFVLQLITWVVQALAALWVVWAILIVPAG